MSSGRTAFIRGLVIGGLVVAAALVLIAPLRDLLPASGDRTRAEEVLETIESSYFRETDAAKLDDASAQGIVKELRRSNEDRFSHYFDPATYRRFLSSTSGQFSGIGLSVAEAKQGLRVSMVFEDTPAEQQGIDVGDLIVAVEGESLKGVSADVAASKIKGPPGTTVTITLIDGSAADGKGNADGKGEELEVERANVRIPAVDGKLERLDGEKIGYVGLATFSRGAHGELRAQIEDLQERGAEGLVLDLRGNGGGLLDEAVLVTSVFQEDGPVVTIEGRARPEQTLDASGDPIEVGPLAVLVDGNTASASEIVAAAIKQNEIGTVVGTRTFGKGTFQEVVELEAGGALDLTVGEYLTSDGTSILNEGVVPDQRVADDDPSDGDDVLDAGLEQVASELDR